MIEADRRDALVNETVRDYLDELIEDFGDECVIPIISYIQRYMGWDMEILLEQSDVENFLMKNHSLFDEDMWLKVLNTKAINEFHSAVFRLSQTYLSDAVAEVLMKEELRTAGEDAPPE
jgi:preprotein translocase subunit SecA